MRTLSPLLYEMRGPVRWSVRLWDSEILEVVQALRKTTLLLGYTSQAVTPGLSVWIKSFTLFLAYRGLVSQPERWHGQAGRACRDPFHFQASALILVIILPHLNGRSRLLPPLLSSSHPFSTWLQEGAFSNEKQARLLWFKLFLGSPWGPVVYLNPL